ncbi:MAG: TonB-dependent siderophore receptor [Flavobacterium sp.]|nr:MAG: TonB-dependent siderophore receptor [Flavobacterium sp.]
MKNIIITSLLLTSFVTFSQEKNDSIKVLREVTVEAKQEKYKKESSTTVSKMPLKDIENPQVYSSIPANLLKEQVVTNFNDALKNATGVTRLWESTGRGGDGAEYYSMRGFSVQPTMINGLPGINNGSIDPINVDNIEVIKGPSGTLFGSSLISYGGLINIVTKKPNSIFGGEISYNAGTYGMDRITADVNIPLNKEVAIRVTSAYQNEDSFQDAGFSKSLFVAPSLSYIVNDKLSFLINTEFTQRESANAPMIFLNRNYTLSFNSIDLFEQNYKNSYTSNELTMNNPTFNLQAQMFYKLSNSWTSQTVLSRSNTKTDGYYHYLWDSANGDEFTRFISRANSQTQGTDIQQNFIGDFKIGNLRNRMVAGIDYLNTTQKNANMGWVGFGTISLVNQSDSYESQLTQAEVDTALNGTFTGNNSAETEVISAYVSDVLNITDKLSVMASVRVDKFISKTEDQSFNQTAVSPKFGVVYQIIQNKVSVFGNYMNGFKNMAPALQSDNVTYKSFKPEHANQYEFGLKTNLYKDIISATVSYYNIDVKDKVMTDPLTYISSLQGGEVNSNGVEISFIANPVKGFNVIAGYSYNDSEVTKDVLDDSYLGYRPEEAGPRALVNLWANYTFVDGTLKGLGIGFGGNHASEFNVLHRKNIGSFKLPDYTIFNTALSYNTSKFNITLKANNLLNEKYYSGWSTVTPQRLRSLTAGLTYKF